MSDLPIRRVVIYKSGVAFFEREGHVNDDDSLDLVFKPTEMNDIIRSLRAVDLDGGQVVNVSYAAADSPLPSVGDDGTIQVTSAVSSTIQYLQGASVKISLSNEEVIIGRVVGSTPAMMSNNKSDTVVIMGDDFKILFVELEKAKSIEIIDKHVSESMKQLLDNTLKGKKKDTRKVSIKCKGKGKRKVRVSYMLENPIWKSNYRIYMTDDPNKKGNKKYFLEGWACVDNISEDEWNDVSLSLVSGSPISFRYEIYNPIIGIRPDQFSDQGNAAQVVQQVQNRAQNNAAYQPNQQPMNQFGQMNQMNQMMNQQQYSYTSPTNYSPASAMGLGGGGPAAMGMGMAIESQTVEIGNLFHYEINTPISVQTNHSALVPTVSGTFTGRKICWFNPKRHSVNPLESILLKNTLGTILDKGPIIVTENENYLGESMLENILLQGEEKVIPYSLNLECKVSSSLGASEQPKSTSIVAGQIQVRKTHLKNTNYSILNNSEHEIELALDHPDLQPEPIDGVKHYRMKEATRFFFPLPSQKRSTFTVTYKSEKVSLAQSIVQMSKFSTAELNQQLCLNKEVFDALMGWADRAEKISELSSQLVELKELEERVINDQQRIRGLLSSVRAETTAQFERQLTELEGKLTHARERSVGIFAEWKGSRDALLKEINDAKFTIDLANANVLTEQVNPLSFSKTTINDFLADAPSHSRLSH